MLISQDAPRRATLFEAKFLVDEETGCWEWTGTKSAKGYGFFYVGNRTMRRAHRVAWELYRGEIPAGLQIDHLCRNPRCVNPDHLEPVTSGENTLRGYRARGPVESCKRGHLFDEANTRWHAGGRKRGCRECARKVAS